MQDSSAFFIEPGDQWDSILEGFEKNKLNDIYFDYRYLNLYVSSSETNVEAFVYKKDNHTFFLPYIKNPVVDHNEYWDFETAYGYSGPIASSDDLGFLTKAWTSFIKLAKEKKIIAGLIRFHPLLDNHKFCQSNSVQINDERQTVWLDCLRDTESIFNDFSKKHLKQIASIEKKGVHVSYSNLKSSLEKFSEIYHSRMTDLGARRDYFFGNDYFKKILLLGEDKWRVYLVYSPEEEIIGGCLLLFSKQFSHYHLSGSLRPFLKYKPNDILRYSVIKDMIKSGIEKVHFGGGRTKDPEDGLLKFKQKFSKQTSTFKVGYCLVDEPSYKIVCENWKKKYPEKNEYKDFFLKYRY